MELFFQTSAIGSRTFQPFPMLFTACLWYLALTSVLMVVQSLPYGAALYLSMVNALSTLKQQRLLSQPAANTNMTPTMVGAAAS